MIDKTRRFSSDNYTFCSTPNSIVLRHGLRVSREQWLDDEEAEKRGMTPIFSAVAGTVRISDDLEPVISVEDHDQAVSQRVDAVVCGRRAINSELAGAVAVNRQSKGCVWLRRSAHVHVVVAVLRDDHLVRRAAPGYAADGQHVVSESERIHSASANCPVRFPEDRPGGGVSAVVMERGEGHQRPLLNSWTRRNTPGDQLDGHRGLGPTLQEELAAQSCHGICRRTHSQYFADAETQVAKSNQRPSARRNSNRQAEEIGSGACALVGMSSAVESGRMRHHDWHLERNLNRTLQCKLSKANAAPH